MTSSDTLSAARLPRWRRCRLPRRARTQKPLASLDLISRDVFPAPSLLAHIGHAHYSLDALRPDLNRFTFLGGNDGEFLLGEDPPNVRNLPRLRPLPADKNHRSSRQARSELTNNCGRNSRTKPRT